MFRSISKKTFTTRREKKIAEQHKEIREKLEDFEVFFDPDFLPGDDDDTT